MMRVIGVSWITVLALLAAAAPVCFGQNGKDAVAFGDSWLYLAKPKGNVEAHMLPATRHEEILDMIRSHPGGRFDTVIVFGGISDILVRDMSIEEAKNRQQSIRVEVERKFHGTRLIMVEIEDILKAFEIYGLDHAHVGYEGYDFLLGKYPELKPFLEITEKFKPQ